VALRAIDHVPQTELRRIAKQSNLRMPILQAARRRVIGSR
jgi:hypothetical protein